MVELADRVITLTGGAGRVEHHPLPQDDPARGKPDITLAEQQLGWRPRIHLDFGLPRTVEYFRALLATR